jgi:hypothetical protein
LPEEETTEVETTLMLPNGHGMVIGGLIQEDDVETQQKVPLLGDLWIVGRLFQRRELNRTRDEVIIALIPHVVPYGAARHAKECADFQRSTTPLTYGPLNQVPRPFEPRFPDAAQHSPLCDRLRRFHPPADPGGWLPGGPDEPCLPEGFYYGPGVRESEIPPVRPPLPPPGWNSLEPIPSGQPAPATPGESSERPPERGPPPERIESLPPPRASDSAWDDRGPSRFNRFGDAPAFDDRNQTARYPSAEVRGAERIAVGRTDSTVRSYPNTGREGSVPRVSLRDIDAEPRIGVPAKSDGSQPPSCRRLPYCPDYQPADGARWQ